MFGRRVGAAPPRRSGSTRRLSSPEATSAPVRPATTHTPPHDAAAGVETRRRLWAGETPSHCGFNPELQRCDDDCPELPGRPDPLADHPATERQPQSWQQEQRKGQVAEVGKGVAVEEATCGCLLSQFCTSNPDANCQIPRCCNCCNWPCMLQPDPATCCDNYPTCCPTADDGSEDAHSSSFRANELPDADPL